MLTPKPENRIQEENVCPVALGLKIISPAQLKVSIYSEVFLAKYKALPELATICGKQHSRQLSKQIDNKSVTRLFQIEALPPTLWIASDNVLQFNSKIAHIASLVKSTADFLSRPELKVTERQMHGKE